MKAMLAVSRAIDKVSAFLGKSVAWLVLAAVLVSATNAIVRKAFDMSSNVWLELQWYLYGMVFLIAASYALQVNEHVRIDFVANMFSKRWRDWVDLIGHTLFLMPFTLMMVWLAWPWFWKSFYSGEISANAGGLVLWPAKAMVLFGFILLTCQGISEIIKRIAVIRGEIDEPYPGHNVPPAVVETGSGYDVQEDGK